MNNIQKRLTISALKSSLKDSFRLFIFTAIVLNLQTILGIIELSGSKYLFGIKFYVTFLLTVTDLFVSSSTQKEIKNYLKRSFLRSCNIPPSNSLRTNPSMD